MFPKVKLASISDQLYENSNTVQDYGFTIQGLKNGYNYRGIQWGLTNNGMSDLVFTELGLCLKVSFFFFYILSHSASNYILMALIPFLGWND